MTTSDVAQRLGVSPGSVRRAEASEHAGHIQVSELERHADVLGCDLVYMLVPRRPLEETVEARARSVARAELTTLAHTMALSGKGLSQEFLLEREKQLAEELKARPGLWLE